MFATLASHPGSGARSSGAKQRSAFKTRAFAAVRLARMKTIRCLFVLMLVGCAAMPVEQNFRWALAPVWQADLPTVLARLKTLPDDRVNEKERRAVNCIKSRFGAATAAWPQEEALPPQATAVLHAYRRYWTDVLMKRATASQAEAALFDALAPWAGADAADLDARSEAAKRMLESQGLRVLGGVTQPLRELMVWRQQIEQQETVALPDGPIDVRVTLLDDFVSLGWAAWASCNESRTGGWATDNGIMVVVPAYDPPGSWREEMLHHEAQHFSDYRRFPKLAQPDLEFRAKLAQLAMADGMQARLLNSFARNARRDRSLPHPFADHWVTERLRQRLGSERWDALPGEAVRQAARAELAQHAAALDALGRDIAVTALPD
jgi:hypothetical protein